MFSDTGAGHRAAAEAVAAALERAHPGQFTVDFFDPMADRHVVAGRLTALYGPITRRVPALWALAYHATTFVPITLLGLHALSRARLHLTDLRAAPGESV